MKKNVIFFVLFLPMYFIAKAQNLVVNPNFDLWDKPEKPYGWTHVENCLKESAEIHSADFSCFHKGGSSTSDLGQTILVSPGKTYSLSLFYKTGVPTTGNGSRIWCYWKDEANISITDPATDATIRPSKYLKSETWEHFSITITAPEKATSFYFEVRTNANSLIYWDDFVFEETIATSISENKIFLPEIYPNPASDFLSVYNTQGIKQVDLQDFNGKIIWSSAISGKSTITIPVSGLNDGLYLLKLSYPGKILLRKFIKQSR